MEAPRQIHKGERVAITCAGRRVVGVVLSAWNEARPGSGPNWYVEITRESDGGYGYWKQRIDGGTIEVLGAGS